MKMVNAVVALAPIGQGVVKSFVNSAQGPINSRAVGAGNNASPVGNKSLSVPATGIVVLSLVYQPGDQDTAPPILKFQQSATDVLQVGFPIDFSGAGQNIAFDMAEGDYDIVTDMAGLVNGGCYYAAYAMQGGIS